VERQREKAGKKGVAHEGPPQGTALGNRGTPELGGKKGECGHELGPPRQPRRREESHFGEENGGGAVLGGKISFGALNLLYLDYDPD